MWVNAAILKSFSPFQTMYSGEFDRIPESTLSGVANAVRAALGVMDGRGEGRVVNVGSGPGYRRVPIQSAFCAAKYGTASLTGAVRSALTSEGSAITMPLVQLPAVSTPQFDWARNRLQNKPKPALPIYAPDVAARAVMKAIHSSAREILVEQSVVKLTVGRMFLPNWLDRTLASDGVTMQKSAQFEPGDRPDNLDEPVSRARGVIVDGDRARGRLAAEMAGGGALLGGALEPVL